MPFERALDGPDDPPGVTVKRRPDPACEVRIEAPRCAEVGERLPDEGFDPGRVEALEVDGARFTRKKTLRGGHDERGAPHESEELPDVRVRVNIVKEQQCVELAENRAQLCRAKVDRQFRAEEGTNHLLTDVLPEHSARRDQRDPAREPGARASRKVAEQDRLADAVVAEGGNRAAALDGLGRSRNSSVASDEPGEVARRRGHPIGDRIEMDLFSDPVEGGRIARGDLHLQEDRLLADVGPDRRLAGNAEDRA